MSGVSKRKFLYFKLYINNLSKKLNGRNVNWFPNGKSLATTVAESVEVSIYGIKPSSVPIESIPGGFGYGTLFVVGGRGDEGYGYGYAIYNGSNATGSRISAIYDKSSGWNECVSKSDLWPQSPGTQIAAGTDMQTITTPGHYYCENNSAAASLKNCPLSDAFTLVVYRAAGGAGDNTYYVAQEYTSYTCNRRAIQTYNKDSNNWNTHEIQFKS